MTSSFTVSRDDVITAALRKVGAIDKTETPDTEDFSDCSFALNLIIKSWVRAGIPMWKAQYLTVPLLNGLAGYAIGPNSFGTGAVTTDRPIRVFSAFLRDSNNNDIPMRILSADEYNNYTSKTNSTSTPTAIWYQPLKTDGLLTVWPVPNDATHSMFLWAQFAISDTTLGTDILDFPSECYQALVWNLADEISEDYGAPADRIERIGMRAKIYKDEMESWSVEEAGLYLSFDTRGD